MRSVVKLTIAAAGLVAISFVAPRAAQAQEKAAEPAVFTLDEGLAKKGKGLWTARACSGCHTIGKGRMAGPDLAHVNDRRTQEWLHNWLKDPPKMIETDADAKALAAQYNNVKMPNMKLTDDDIKALVHHIAKESQKVKKSEK
jgi:cbb3-type cytochrome oxidase cytochrome c subunit